MVTRHLSRHSSPRCSRWGGHDGAAVRITIDRINQLFDAHPRSCVAFSGGSDSLVLLDMVYTRTAHRPPVIYADDQMSHPQTRGFVETTCRGYGADLHVAKANRTPKEQWAASGWPMLGKMPAWRWTKNHRHRNMGFKLGTSSCCKALKSRPARKLTRALGMTAQLTGQRGGSDDEIRGLHTIRDSWMTDVIADKIAVANPLTGWTDTMIRRYLDQNRIARHPARESGDFMGIGCIYCGGSGNYSNSSLRSLRIHLPTQWWWYIVEACAGEVILALKYDSPIRIVRSAIEDMGGLDTLATERPWIFDFTARTPRKGYEK